MKKHFVTFYSPGTFVPEETTKPIKAWDTIKAMKMAHDITERHGATPYAFVFATRERGEKDLDSREVARSGKYFLGGQLLSFSDVVARNSPKDSILISNMRVNGIKTVIENDNSWRACCEFGTRDVLLDWKPGRKVKEPSVEFL